MSKKRKPAAASPEELRFKASRCSARALAWLKRGAELERLARRLEKKREAWERQEWPEQFCKTCQAGKPCQLHNKQGEEEP